METRIAKYLSYLFHPLILPTYTFFILLWLNVYFSMILPEDAKWMILALIFTVTFVIPVTIIFLFLKRGALKFFLMEEKEQRLFPLVVMVIFYYLAYYLVRQLQVYHVFYMFLLGADLLIIIALIVNFFWKISLHMVGLGGVTGLILALSITYSLNLMLVIFVLIMCSGLTGSARLKLKSHNPPQVYAGYLTGMVVMFMLMTV